MQGGDVWLEAWWIVVHRVECAQRVVLRVGVPSQV